VAALQPLKGIAMKTQLTARRQAGLSLVEPLVALCVASLALGTALPNFKSLTERRALEGAAGQLRSELQYARSLAVERNQAVRLTFEPAANGMCYVIHTGGSKACKCANLPAPVCTADSTVLRHFSADAPGRISIKSNSASFAFDPTSGTVTPTATLELQNRQGDALRLVINIMGRIRSCTPTGKISGQPKC
jgi:type IV fimbrial biogenesis protein FimT